MTTKEFLQTLEKHPELPLYFEYKSGAFARSDYHITEVKNVHFDTVDCGGVRNEWKEVHVQIWENAMPEPNHSVNTSKALKIFNVVDKVRETWGDIEMKIEYGNANFHTAILPVGQIEIHGDKMIVKLGEGQTSCKAQDRATTPEEKAVACCAPVVLLEEQVKPKVNLSNLITSNDSCCSPDSGCC